MACATEEVLALGFEQCTADACVFRLAENGLTVTTVVVHVDDVFVWRRRDTRSFAVNLEKWCLSRTWARLSGIRAASTRERKSWVA